MRHVLNKLDKCFNDFFKVTSKKKPRATTYDMHKPRLLRCQVLTSNSRTYPTDKTTICDFLDCFLGSEKSVKIQKRFSAGKCELNIKYTEITYLSARSS